MLLKELPVWMFDVPVLGVEFTIGLWAPPAEAQAPCNYLQVGCCFILYLEIGSQLLSGGRVPQLLLADDGLMLY